jgi:argininosuccinate synthase
MDACARTLVVFYDSYHTPISELAQHLSGSVTVLVPILNLPAPSIGPIVCEGWDVVELDLRSRFCNEILQKAIKANARYQGGYYLSAALSRPLIAAACVETLAGRGEACIVHGFAGNDQVRFEAAVLALNGALRVKCAAELVGSRTSANNEQYTVSENLWGRSTEAGPLANPWHCAVAFDEPDVSDVAPVELVISFEGGVPVALNGTALELLEIIERLGAHATLRPLDMVEDGWVGLKSRALYNEPAAEVLVGAHADLERFVSSRQQNLFKTQIDDAWSRLIYEGGWFDPQRASLDAYIDDVNRRVSGDVRVSIGRHGVRVTGRRSGFALYDEGAAIYRFGQDTGLELVRGLRNQVAATARIALSRRNGA